MLMKQKHVESVEAGMIRGGLKDSYFQLFSLGFK